MAAASFRPDLVPLGKRCPLSAALPRSLSPAIDAFIEIVPDMTGKMIARRKELPPERSLPLCLRLDERRERQRYRFAGRVVLSNFDVDDFGIPRAQVVQFAAYSGGIVFVVEHLPPFVIG
jgi:hypothetical protein